MHLRDSCCPGPFVWHLLKVNSESRFRRRSVVTVGEGCHDRTVKSITREGKAVSHPSFYQFSFGRQGVRMLLPLSRELTQHFERGTFACYSDLSCQSCSTYKVTCAVSSQSPHGLACAVHSSFSDFFVFSFRWSKIVFASLKMHIILLSVFSSCIPKTCLFVFLLVVMSLMAEAGRVMPRDASCIPHRLKSVKLSVFAQRPSGAILRAVSSLTGAS